MNVAKLSTKTCHRLRKICLLMADGGLFSFFFLLLHDLSFWATNGRTLQIEKYSIIKIANIDSTLTTRFTACYQTQVES